MSKHRWADEIKAWAERGSKAIQCQRVAADHVPGLADKWSDHYPTDDHGTPEWNNPRYRWRIKPRVCSLNGYEFPAPIREAPPEGGTVWLADPAFHNLAVAGLVWTDDELKFHCWLRRGRLHTIRDAAIAHARAEILAVGGTLEDES